MNSVDNTHILGKFDKVSVLVIGDLMVDRYVSGVMSRISPEAPTPLIEITGETVQLGGAANAINTIRSLGASVLATGFIGDDWFGKKMLGLLKKENVDSSNILSIKERPTTVKTRIIVGRQQILRLDSECKNPLDDEYTRDLLDIVQKNIDSVDVILISDYNKGVVTNSLLKGITSLAMTHSKPVVIYPKVENFLDYKNMTFVITDLEKASAVTGIRQINETSIRNMGHWLLTHIECQFILITRGKDGLTLFEKNGTVTHYPTNIEEFRNKLGTIDTLASVIALSLATEGISGMRDAVNLANLAWGIVASKREYSVITRDEIKKMVDNLNISSYNRVEKH